MALRSVRGDIFPRFAETVGAIPAFIVLFTDKIPQQYHVQREKGWRPIPENRLRDRYAGN